MIIIIIIYTPFYFLWKCFQTLENGDITQENLSLCCLIASVVSEEKISQYHRKGRSVPTFFQLWLTYLERNDKSRIFLPFSVSQ